MAVSTNVDISDDESGIAKGILFKASGRSNETDDTHFAVQESARVQTLHRSDMYVVVISCFHSTLRLKT